MTETLDMAAAFMPHGHCFLWEPSTLISTVAGDLLTASFYLIGFPLIMLSFSRFYRIAWTPPMILLTAFVVSCGVGHAFDIWNVWNTDYRPAGWWRVVVGVVSWSFGVSTYIYIHANRALLTSLSQLSSADSADDPR